MSRIKEIQEVAANWKEYLEKFQAENVSRAFHIEQRVNREIECLQTRSVLVNVAE